MNYIEILKDWNFWGKAVETGIPRTRYLQQLIPLVKLPEIIALKGVRRCGKSTLLLQLIETLHQKNNVPYKNSLFINFEDPRLPEDLQSLDLFKILETYKKSLKPEGRIFLFLDEAHRVKEWERFVLTLYDQKADIKVFVTGSNTDLLGSEVSTLLSGRYLTFPVAPLDFKEFLAFKNIRLKKEKASESLIEYLEFGGFPRVVLEEDPFQKRNLLIAYYDTIIEKDVILRHNIKNKRELKNLARFVFSNVAQITSTYRLEKTLGTSNINIQRYLHHLEESFLISRVPFFSFSVKRQIYNPSKTYVVDSGLANVVGFKFSENRGALLENAVFQKLATELQDIFYWKNGTEIDFLTFKENKVQTLINVTETVDDTAVFEREMKSLEIGKKEFKEVPTKLISLYNQSGRKEKFLCPLIDFLL